jgi:4-hydroxy-tetrahydrodipicolinate synthase
VLSGSTGESPTTSRREKLLLFRSVMRAVGRRCAVVAGTGNNNTAESVDLTVRVAAMGVDAVMLVVPAYNKPQQEGLYRHFLAIANSVNIPCILYNVPSRTSTNMTAETTIRLSEISNIIGIKEASGDMKQINDIINGTRENQNKFYVWSGNDDETVDIMIRGGYGAVSVASHLIGSHILNIIVDCHNGEMAKAILLNDALRDLYDALFIETNPVPLKCALNMLGIDVGDPRLPLVTMHLENIDRLKKVLHRYKDLIDH